MRRLAWLCGHLLLCLTLGCGRSLLAGAGATEDADDLVAQSGDGEEDADTGLVTWSVDLGIDSSSEGVDSFGTSDDDDDSVGDDDDDDDDDLAEELCDNGFDDDGDGQVDCDDEDCDSDIQCSCPGYVVESGEELCLDGIDNDCDGATDCEQDSCQLLPICSCDGYEAENTVATCMDGVDNDCRGGTDRCELGCRGVEGVPGTCNNGHDDDRDGQVDCQDPACAASCTQESGRFLCANGFDDDGDGKIDCQDEDCGLESCAFSPGWIDRTLNQELLPFYPTGRSPGGPAPSEISIDAKADGGYVVAGRLNNQLGVVSYGPDGDVLWTSVFPPTDLAYPGAPFLKLVRSRVRVIPGRDDLYLASFLSGRLYRINGETGAVEWSRIWQTGAASAAHTLQLEVTADGSARVGSAGAENLLSLRSFDLDGQEQWQVGPVALDSPDYEGRLVDLGVDDAGDSYALLYNAESGALDIVVFDDEGGAVGQWTKANARVDASGIFVPAAMEVTGDGALYLAFEFQPPCEVAGPASTSVTLRRYAKVDDFGFTDVSDTVVNSPQALVDLRLTEAGGLWLLSRGYGLTKVPSAYPTGNLVSYYGPAPVAERSMATQGLEYYRALAGNDRFFALGRDLAGDIEVRSFSAIADADTTTAPGRPAP